MPRFRTIPVYVEARRVAGPPHEVADVAGWCGGYVETFVAHDGRTIVPKVRLMTRIGLAWAASGDWIISHEGEHCGYFTVCLPEDVNRLYEKAD